MARRFLPNARKPPPVFKELGSLRLAARCAPESASTMGRKAGLLAQGGKKAGAAELLGKNEKLAIAKRTLCTEDARNPPEDRRVAARQGRRRNPYRPREGRV